MGSENIKNNIFSIGVKDAQLRIFDIIMETKRGTTYNSFVINDEKVAIIDICKNGFYDEYKKNLKEVIGDKAVDYIIYLDDNTIGDTDTRIDDKYLKYNLNNYYH